MSTEIRVMSANRFSQVARNAELCGLKFYHARQYPTIPITSVHFFRLINYRMRYIIIYCAYFVVNQGLKSKIYYTFLPLDSSHYR